MTCVLEPSRVVCKPLDAFRVHVPCQTSFDLVTDEMRAYMAHNKCNVNWYIWEVRNKQGELVGFARLLARSNNISAKRLEKLNSIKADISNAKSILDDHKKDCPVCLTPEDDLINGH